MSQETNESNNGEPVDDDSELPPNWIPLIDDNDSRWSVPKKVPEPLQVRACHILIKHRDVKNPVSKGALRELSLRRLKKLCLKQKRFAQE